MGPRAASPFCSPDESFGVGEDTGTPVAEDYTGRMPFRFTHGKEGL
jgi:hypothetical protein